MRKLWRGFLKFISRFSKFGSVSKVEIKSKRDIDGEVGNFCILLLKLDEKESINETT